MKGKEMNERIRPLAEQAGIDYDRRPEIARAPYGSALMKN